MEGRRYKWWWFGGGGGVGGGVGFMKNGDLCEKLAELRRMSDKVMEVVSVFVWIVLRLTCGWVCSAKWRTFWRKSQFLC